MTEGSNFHFSDAAKQQQPVIVRGKCEVLSRTKLRRATGESAIVHGKTDAKVDIANICVSHAFIVADVVNEVIIGAGFMITQGINFNMRSQVMS